MTFDIVVVFVFFVSVFLMLWGHTDKFYSCSYFFICFFPGQSNQNILNKLKADMAYNREEMEPLYSSGLALQGLVLKLLFHARPEVEGVTG